MTKTYLAVLAMIVMLPLTLHASEPSNPEGLPSKTPSETSGIASNPRSNPYTPEAIDCDPTEPGVYEVPDSIASSPDQVRLASDVVGYVLARLCTDLMPRVNEIIVTEVGKAIAATQNAERQHYDPELAGKDAQIAFLEGTIRDANRRIAELQRGNFVEDIGKVAIGAAVAILGQHLLNIGGTP